MQAFTDLINQTVGDAFSDLLMVEAILISRGLSFEDWDAAYTDLPNQQEKIKAENFISQLHYLTIILGSGSN